MGPGVGSGPRVGPSGDGGFCMGPVMDHGSRVGLRVGFRPVLVCSSARVSVTTCAAEIVAVEVSLSVC